MTSLESMPQTIPTLFHAKPDSLGSSDQGKEFRGLSKKRDFYPKPSGANRDSIAALIENSRRKLSSLASRAIGTIEEGFRGMNDDANTKRLRADFDSTITGINAQYADTVLHTGEILDKFGKKVGVQEQMLIDAVKDFNWRSKSDQAKMASLRGRQEDSAIYQKMGSAKYTVYTVIALVVIGLTMTHMDLNFAAYISMAIVLVAVFIFILNYFYWKKSVYNTS